jgi:hypothetical protein
MVSNSRQYGLRLAQINFLFPQFVIAFPKFGGGREAAGIVLQCEKKKHNRHGRNRCGYHGLYRLFEVISLDDQSVDRHLWTGEPYQ